MAKVDDVVEVQHLGQTIVIFRRVGSLWWPTDYGYRLPDGTWGAGFLTQGEAERTAMRELEKDTANGRPD
jgi:hypothetical protein